MRRLSCVLAPLFLGACSTAVQLPDLQRVESASIPEARRFMAQDEHTFLRPGDLVVFTPKDSGRRGQLITVKAGACDTHGGSDACEKFWKSLAAFKPHEKMSASSAKAIVPVAAFGCVAEFDVILGGGGSIQEAKAGLPLPSTCPVFSGDAWLARSDFDRRLRVPAREGRPAVKDLFDIDYIFATDEKVLPGETVFVSQSYQVGLGVDDELKVRPVLTTETRANVDRNGRILVPSPSPVDFQPCHDGTPRCSQQRALASSLVQALGTVRVSPPETCQAQLPSLADAQLCLSSGWKPGDLQPDSSPPYADRQRIHDVCERKLDIDLAFRQFQGRQHWENLSLSLRAEQHWTLIGHDGARTMLPYSPRPNDALSTLEQVYRERYGRTLVSEWFRTEAHVIIVPSPHRCDMENKALWLVHRHGAPADTALAQTLILPGDTVYVTYRSPSSN